MAKRDVGYLGQRAGMTTGARAGKSKASAAKRKEQNKGVVSGAIRKGAKGKGYNVYDAETGTWKKLKPAAGGGKSGSYRGIGTSRVSPSRRGEGSGKSQTPAQRASARNSGFVRGIGGMGKDQIASRTSQLKKDYNSSTLRGALAKKRQEDTKNQYRNAAIVGALGTLPAGAAGATAAAGRLGIAGLTRAAGQGLVRGAKDATGQGARATAKTAAKPKKVTTVKEAGGKTSGVSRVSGGATKGGKPATYGPRKPTAAQQAAARRSAAAKKAAATRRANAAKRGSEGPKGRKR